MANSIYGERIATMEEAVRNTNVKLDKIDEKLDKFIEKADTVYATKSELSFVRKELAKHETFGERKTDNLKWWIAFLANHGWKVLSALALLIASIKWRF